ncbi:GTPase-activating protein gyp8 [Blastocladiella emersonii ATCC 22665]|nr:GTPase-activating protein gyp8 [Blastocladiella emersonii ATCC 22665]
MTSANDPAGGGGTSVAEVEIREAIERQDLPKLRSLGAKHGFLTKPLRQRAWPILLRCTEYKLPTDKEYAAMATTYEHQIRLDVNRSFVHFTDQLEDLVAMQPPLPHSSPSSPGGGFGAEEDDLFVPPAGAGAPPPPRPDAPPPSRRDLLKLRGKAMLQRMLVRLVSRYPFLHYYQGLHDICTILLLVLGERMGTCAAEVLALYYLRDAMHKSLEPVMQQMRVVLPLIKMESKPIYTLLEECELHPYFCLSWVIGWFSHDLTSFDAVCRLFDFFLCSNPVMPVYLSAAIVLRQHDDLMDLDRDFALVHSFLSKVPRDPDAVDGWIHDAARLYYRYPLDTVAGMTGWRFDPGCAAVRFDRDFPGTFKRLPLAPSEIEDLMHSGAALQPAATGTGDGDDGIYAFKPLPITKRMGRAYVPVEGDAPALILITAVAIGVLSMSIGILQRGGGGAADAAAAAQGIDVLGRVLVLLLRS